MSDLNFQDFSTVQSNQQLPPATVASAATIAVTTRMTKITGTVSITKITPPVSGYHELVFKFASAYADAFNVGGSGDGAIATAYTSLVDRPITLYYDPTTKLYYLGALS